MISVLHITPHLGGGVGTVLMAWMKKECSEELRRRRRLQQVEFDHSLLSLDSINEKVKTELTRLKIRHGSTKNRNALSDLITISDIVVVHYWDSPSLEGLLSKPLPPCRLVFWCHKNYDIPKEAREYPDVFVGTSPIQKCRHIRSTGDIEDYLAIKPAMHARFTVGYVGWVDYRKMHPRFFGMCEKYRPASEAMFIVCGENKTSDLGTSNMRLLGHVDDIKPWLAQFDVFGYPLRRDHFGTCEQVLGEAMAAGVPPVVFNNPCESQIVDDSINGFVVKNENEYLLALQFLHDYPAIRNMMSHNARHRARELYNIEKMVQSWDDLFHELMEKPKNEKSGINRKADDDRMLVSEMQEVPQAPCLQEKD
jgi:glycosyltransferase involved in cell wall biosynthesis